MEFEYPARERELEERLEEALGLIGLTRQSGAAAVLRFDLRGSARPVQYQELGTCHMEPRVRGTAQLVSDERPTLETRVDGEVGSPFQIYASECAKEPADAPFLDALDVAMLDAMASFFGAASIPLLADVVSRFSDGWSSVSLPKKLAAIAAYRALDRRSIPIDLQYQFLRGVLHYAGGGVTGPTSDREYIRAARRLLLEYSDTDYGFENDADIDAWHEWLDGWRADHIGPAVRDDDGLIVAAGTIAMADLRLGDCFDLWDERRIPNRDGIAIGVPCAEPHDIEVYLVFDMPAGEYPGWRAIRDVADPRCNDGFESFVGVPSADSEMRYSSPVPTEKEWARRDRAVLCILRNSDNSKLVGSARGTAR